MKYQDRKKYQKYIKHISFGIKTMKYRNRKK